MGQSTSADAADETQRLFTPAFITLTLVELAYFTAVGVLIPATPLFGAMAAISGSIPAAFVVGAMVSICGAIGAGLAARSEARRSAVGGMAT